MTVTLRTSAHRSLVPLVAVLILAACSGGKAGDAADADQAVAAQDTAGAMSGMEAMQDMPGMPGMGGSGMLAQMQAHMRMMDGAGADSMLAMLPTHRQLVANMIVEFNRDMRGMNMPSDAAWTATVDSLRQDLTRMPEMSGAELHQFMPAHGARVRRLMESHQGMMGSMRR